MKRKLDMVLMQPEKLIIPMHFSYVLPEKHKEIHCSTYFQPIASKIFQIFTIIPL